MSQNLFHKKTYKQFITISLLLFFFTGFLYDINAESSSSFMLRINNYMKNNEENMNLLYVKVKNLQEQQDKYNYEISSLQKALASEKSNNQNLQQQITALKQEMSQLAQTTNQNLNKVVEQVANETSKAINKATASKAEPTTSTGGPPYGSGQFYTYKVQAGATLNAVAKAYNVSVDSIKKANGLKDDSIRLDQTLFIPKK